MKKKEKKKGWINSTYPFILYLWIRIHGPKWIRIRIQITAKILYFCEKIWVFDDMEENMINRPSQKRGKKGEKGRIKGEGKGKKKEERGNIRKGVGARIWILDIQTNKHPYP